MIMGSQPEKAIKYIECLSLFSTVFPVSKELEPDLQFWKPMEGPINNTTALFDVSFDERFIVFDMITQSVCWQSIIKVRSLLDLVCELHRNFSLLFFLLQHIFPSPPLLIHSLQTLSNSLGKVFSP